MVVVIKPIISAIPDFQWSNEERGREAGRGIGIGIGKRLRVEASWFPDCHSRDVFRRAETDRVIRVVLLCWVCRPNENEARCVWQTMVRDATLFSCHRARVFSNFGRG